jgi:AraC family transcriptional regulator
MAYATPPNTRRGVSAARAALPPSLFREQPSSRMAAYEAAQGQGRADAPAVDVRVEAYPDLRVAFMRHRGGYMGVEETWQRLIAWAAARGLLGETPCLYGVCPDDPEITDEPLLRFDACVVVDEAFADPAGTVAVAIIPAGTYAVGLHVGPYDRLHETYLDVIGRWFPVSGYELAPDAVIQHYLNDPRNTPASELRTEVRVRIAD